MVDAALVPLRDAGVPAEHIHFDRFATQADDARPEIPTSPPDATSRPGVDAPVWDDARDAYIQWDPDLGAWMEWSEAQSRWLPISR